MSKARVPGISSDIRFDSMKRIADKEKGPGKTGALHLGKRRRKNHRE
jgi:hypothetical protein